MKIKKLSDKDRAVLLAFFIRNPTPPRSPKR